MVDQISADKGWTLDYILSLTYRQVAMIYERLWDRKSWEIELSIASNPFCGSDDESDTSADGFNLLDGTTDEGLQDIASQLNIPIKTRKARS